MESLYAELVSNGVLVRCPPAHIQVGFAAARRAAAAVLKKRPLYTAQPTQFPLERGEAAGRQEGASCLIA
jgi:hypothetical protein